MGGCDQFALGSAARSRCLGETSGWSIAKTNRWRASFGIEPLEDLPTATTETATTTITRTARSRAAARQVPQTLTGGCCGGGKAKPTISAEVLISKTVPGTGVGGRLLEMFHKAGFESCEACYALAHQMNQWGPDECEKRINEIVADILPRAIEWERQRIGWISKLLPTGVTEAAIQTLVTLAIHTAPPLQRVTPPRRKHSRRPASQYVRRNPNKLRPPLIGRPIDRDRLVSHMLYHFLPLAGDSEPIWRRHCDWLREVRADFNGRLLVGIATPGEDRPGHEIMPAEAVIEALAGLDAEFVLQPNHSRIGEGKTFPLMLAKIESTDPNEVFFYGHSKGVTRPHEQPPQLWAEALFDTTFRNRDAAIDALDSAGCVGPFRMPGGKAVNLPGVGPWWFFSGTFFAVRSVDAFRRNWRTIPKHYGCVEQWPRLNFDRLLETACLFHDETANLYDQTYWQDTVTPAFNAWKEAHDARLCVR